MLNREEFLDNVIEYLNIIMKNSADKLVADFNGRISAPLKIYVKTLYELLEYNNIDECIAIIALIYTDRFAKICHLSPLNIAHVLSVCHLLAMKMFDDYSISTKAWCKQFSTAIDKYVKMEIEMLFVFKADLFVTIEEYDKLKYSLYTYSQELISIPINIPENNV